MSSFVPKKSNSYYAVHMYMLNHFGKATKCENLLCVYPRKERANGRMMEKPKRYEWANISGEYKRERADWMELCPSCHRMRDIQIKKENLAKTNI